MSAKIDTAIASSQPPVMLSTVSPWPPKPGAADLSAHPLNSVRRRFGNILLEPVKVSLCSLALTKSLLLAAARFRTASPLIARCHDFGAKASCPALGRAAGSEALQADLRDRYATRLQGGLGRSIPDGQRYILQQAPGACCRPLRGSLMCCAR